VAEYLNEQHSEGYWASGEDVYWPKWTATVWPLILLGEIGVRARILDQEGSEYFLKVMDAQDRSWPAPKYPDEDLQGWRAVWEPCITGNMARTLAAFGYGDDSRVREMFEWLIKNQRDDGAGTARLKTTGTARRFITAPSCLQSSPCGHSQRSTGRNGRRVDAKP